MIVYVDTSAFFAVLDADDSCHSVAAKVWEELVSQNTTLICNNYILVESFALIQNRLGMAAVNELQNNLIPIIKIEWVDEQLHRSGISAFLTASQKKLSLVDCTSFETMRKLGIQIAFTFDHHFADRGFKCLPV